MNWCQAGNLKIRDAQVPVPEIPYTRRHSATKLSSLYIFWNEERFQPPLATTASTSSLSTGTYSAGLLAMRKRTCVKV